ncbi:hypothetical protein [Leclercia sp. M-A074-M]|uniref:hypothetical protein n=1 Tax=Leclercia sp. M-A074-M TaxID=3402294 RepID=UPI003B24F862
MLQKLPSKDRLAELAAFNTAGTDNAQPATMDEWKAMAEALLSLVGKEAFGEVVFGIERDESDELTNQKYIDYSLDAIEALPVGTKLYAVIPTPAQGS